MDKRFLHTTLFRLSLEAAKTTLVERGFRIIETRGYGYIKCVDEEFVTVAYRQIYPSIWVPINPETDSEDVENFCEELFEFLQALGRAICEACESMYGEAIEMDEESLEIIAKAKDSSIGFGRYITKDDSHIYAFESMQQVENLLEQHSDVVWRRISQVKRAPKEYDKWVGKKICTLEEGLTISKEVNKEELQIVEMYVEKLKDKINIELLSNKRELKFRNDGGDEVDYDRMRAGQEEFWRSSSRDRVEEVPFLQIVTDLSTGSFVSSEDVLWRGAAAIAVTEILESQGYRIQLVGAVAGREIWDGGNFCSTYLLLKDYEDTVNISHLANTVSGWYLRSMIFQLWTVYAKLNNSNPNKRLGKVCTINDKLTDAVYGQTENRMIISNVWSFDAAYNAVLAECKRFERK